MNRLLLTLFFIGMMASIVQAKVIDFYFNSEIDAKSVTITQISLDAIINETPSPEVRFWLNSPGGSVVSSIALYDYLIRLRKDGVRVDTYATGLCASGATVVLQAGQVRYMTPFTLFMIHGCHTAYPEPKNAWEWVSQKYDAWQDRGMRKFIDDDLRDLYICRTHLPRKRLENMMKGDCWLRAIDAKELGFVDKLYIEL